MSHPGWKAAGLAILWATFAARDLGAFSLLERFSKIDIRQVVVAPAVAHGRVDSVRVSYLENSMTKALCTATVTTDDQRTIEFTTEPPPALQRDIMTTNPYIPYRDAFCDELQTASAEGWKVSMSLQYASATESLPAGWIVTRLETGPEASPTSTSTSLETYSCPSGNCTPEGTVTSIVTDINSREVLCQAALKIMPASGTPQRADARVILPIKLPNYSPTTPTLSPAMYAFFQAKRSVCAGFLNAMAYGQTVAVTGAMGTDGNITASYLERKAPGTETSAP